MKIIQISTVIVFLISINLQGQNLIGYSEKDVRQYMTDNQKEMTFQSFINNSTFKYLKYTNSDETITLLFFLNEQSICKSVRFVCDKSLKTEKTKELDSKYTKIGENQWVETKNGKKYLIEMKEEDWSFNVTIKLNE
jgi:hypothetical protein